MQKNFRRAILLAVVCIFLSSIAFSADESLCCFLNPFVSMFKSVLNSFGLATTTTTTSTTTSTSTTSTTSTTETTTSTETSTTMFTTTTTSTTLRVGGCNSYVDCPGKQVVIKCRGDGKNKVTEETTIFACIDPGMNESTCKGNMKSNIVRTCPKGFMCVEGDANCTKVSMI